MNELKRRLVDWIEHRTGLETAIKEFLYEEIPASSGWPHVFGSVAVFLFLLQAFTGLLLAFNYAPTPGEAYNSVKYIISELTGGQLIRGLHHWGASLMIVVVVLHMIQVFISGAYKKPREATWMVGVCLLLLTLAYGLTGYLLPWDNRAYWGTVVTTQIASKAPLLGPYLTRLLGSDGSIGVVTSPDDFHACLKAIHAAGFKTQEADIGWHAKTGAPIADRETAEKFLVMVDLLEELDDVQNVFSNAELPDDL